MKIVVTGAEGTMAMGGIISLLEHSDVSQVVLTYYTSEATVKERIASLGDKRLVTKPLDLMDIKSATEIFKGADVVFNSALMTTNVPAMKAALEAGVNYVDLGAFDKSPQRALSDEFKKKGITAIMGMGIGSGMTNILSAYCVGKLDKVESIDLLASIVDTEEHTYPLHCSYALETILDEFSEKGPYFDNGELKWLPARSLPEMFTFKVGTILVATTIHSEPMTLSEVFRDKGIKHVGWKIGFDPEFEAKVKFLCDLGFAKKEPIDVQGQTISPRAVLMALLKDLPPETKKAPNFRGHLVVIVKGEEAGQKVEYTAVECATPSLTERMEKKGALGCYLTGFYGAIGALMLARGQIEKKGAFYPEECVPPELFLKKAAEAGDEVDVSRKVWL